MNDKVDALCSHTGRLGSIELDVVEITKSAKALENKADAVSSFVSISTNVSMTSDLLLGTSP